MSNENTNVQKCVCEVAGAERLSASFNISGPIGGGCCCTASCWLCAARWRLSCPPLATRGVLIVLGVALIVGGVATIVMSFWAGKWTGMLVQLLVGVLYLVAGFAIFDTPVKAALVLTLFIAALFIVVGAFRILAAMMVRFPHWGWALLNGIVTFLLGVIIYRQFPQSAIWVLGLLIGIEMLFNGWTWIMLSLADPKHSRAKPPPKRHSLRRDVLAGEAKTRIGNMFPRMVPEAVPHGERRSAGINRLHARVLAEIVADRFEPLGLGRFRAIQDRLGRPADRRRTDRS